MHKTLLAAFTGLTLSIGAVGAAPVVSKEPLGVATLNTIKSRPKPLLMIINWLGVGRDWKVACEIILPVAPAPTVKG
jgi:hypothetical protein